MNPSNAILASYVLAQDFADRVIHTLNAAGIIPLPFKGVLLQKTVYAPNQRGLSDIDLLIHRDQVEMAAAALLADGYYMLCKASHATVWQHPDVPMNLDLHDQLFPGRWYRMPTQALIDRARQDDSLFNGKVYKMADYDVYASLVGHFAKNRHNRTDHMHLLDFGAVADTLGLVPDLCAKHLELCGLGRASRYVLQLAARHAGDAFASNVLDCLERDRVGDAIAVLVHSTLGKLDTSNKLGILPATLTNYSIPASCITFSQQIGYGIRRRAQGLRFFSNSSINSQSEIRPFFSKR